MSTFMKTLTVVAVGAALTTAPRNPDVGDAIRIRSACTAARQRASGKI